MRLRNNVKVVQQDVTRLRNNARKDIGAMKLLLATIREARLSPTRPLTLEKEALLAQSTAVADKLAELQAAVDLLRQDVTKRKVKPAMVRATVH